jgi:hypothetical protein
MAGRFELTTCANEVTRYAAIAREAEMANPPKLLAKFWLDFVYDQAATHLDLIR